MDHELDDAAVADLLNDKRYFAFADVLGYKGILFGGSAPQEQRVRWLYEAWECLNPALQPLGEMCKNTDVILFSDSVFLSSIDAVELACATGLLMQNVFSYYATFPERWMPWLRVGMSHGWGIDVNDVTLSDKLKEPIAAFRNPAGPAPAEAYVLAEGCGFKGPRILVPESVKTEIIMRLKTEDWSEQLLVQTVVEPWTKPWPYAGEAPLPSGATRIYDLPWWRCLPFGGAEAARRLTEHAWQIDATGGKGREHFEAGIALVEERAPRGFASNER